MTRDCILRAQMTRSQASETQTLSSHLARLCSAFAGEMIELGLPLRSIPSLLLRNSPLLRAKVEKIGEGI